jgi:hypothetical protein
MLPDKTIPANGEEALLVPVHRALYSLSSRAVTSTLNKRRCFPVSAFPSRRSAITTFICDFSYTSITKTGFCGMGKNR